MNGLIKPSKLGHNMLGDIGSFGALAIAFYSVSAVLYIMFAGSSLA